MKLLGSHRMIAFKTVNESNKRETPFARAERAKSERRSAYWAGLFAMPPRTWFPKALQELPGRFVVRLTRFAPGATPLDVHDGLPSACKHVVDGIADRLGVDDGNVARFRVEYRQERGPYAVLVEIHVEDLVQNSGLTAQTGEP